MAAAVATPIPIYIIPFSSTNHQVNRIVTSQLNLNRTLMGYPTRISINVWNLSHLVKILRVAKNCYTEHLESRVRPVRFSGYCTEKRLSNQGCI